MVFNTQTTNDVTPGYYYWYETKWYRIASTSDRLEETITTLMNQGNGQFLYTSEDGTETIINIPASVVDDIINGGAIYNQITNVIQAEQATTSLVNGTNTTVVVNSPNPPQPNNTEYAVNVANAKGTNLGVVKEVAENPTVTINEDGELSVNLESLNEVVHTAVDYIVSLKDMTVLANAVANDVNITLPAATPDTKGKKYTIRKLDTNEANYIYVQGNIAGTSGQVLYTGVPYTGWDFISDGNQWHIVNSF